MLQILFYKLQFLSGNKIQDIRCSCLIKFSSHHVTQKLIWIASNHQRIYSHNLTKQASPGITVIPDYVKFQGHDNIHKYCEDVVKQKSTRLSFVMQNICNIIINQILLDLFALTEIKNILPWSIILVVPCPLKGVGISMIITESLTT